jgi:hypothetical protein
MGHEHEHLTEFDSDLGFAGMNRDVQVAEADAEDRRAVAEMADSPNAAKSLKTVADELALDELAAMEERILAGLAGRQIKPSSIVTARMVQRSSRTPEERPAGYSADVELCTTVRARGYGYSPHECEAELLANVDKMLGDAAPFRVVPLTSEGPRAA